MPADPIPQMPPPADVPALPAPRSEARPTGSRTGRCLVYILEIGLLIAVIAALVAAYYFGWPVVYRQVFLPIQDHATRVAAIETQRPAGQEQLRTLQTQVSALATADAGISTVQAGHFGVLENSVDERFQAVAALQYGLATEQAGLAAALATLVPRVDALESTAREQSRALPVVQSTLVGVQSTQVWMQATLQANDAPSRFELERRVTLLKSMELLSRARLFLYESNYGLAKQDVQAARDLLSDLYGYPPGPDMAEILRNLDQAIAHLPDFPVPASDDLDSAWQLLLRFGGPTATPTPTPWEPTSTPWETPTLTPTPTPWVTPTPTP